MATQPAPDSRAQDHPSPPWPAWATWVQVAFVMAIVAFVALDADIPRRVVVIPLVLLVSSAWLVELFGVRVPLGVKAIVTLGVIGTINIGAERFGWNDPNGLVQITLMIVLLLVGEAVATASIPMAVAIVVGAAVITASPLIPDDHGEHHVWSIALVISVMVGVFLRALLEALTEVEAAQAERTAQAAIDERHRIAREVHDVIAHSLTVTMLHITAARLAVGGATPPTPPKPSRRPNGPGDRAWPTSAAPSGCSAEDAGDGRDAPRTTRPPRLGPAPLWSSEYRSAGLRRRAARFDGDTDAIAPQVGLALYRIVQESLANAARHTPGARATVYRRHHRRPSGCGCRAPGAAPARLRGSGLRTRRHARTGRGPRRSCTAGADGGGWAVEAVLPAAPVASEAAVLIRVLLVDDQPLVRAGLTRILVPRRRPRDRGRVRRRRRGRGRRRPLPARRRADGRADEAHGRRRGHPPAPGAGRARHPSWCSPPSTTTRSWPPRSAPGAAGFVLKDARGEDLSGPCAHVAGGGGWLDPAVAGRVIATYRRDRPAPGRGRPR